MTAIGTRGLAPGDVPKRPAGDPAAAAKVALVHDYVTQMGGSERVVELLLGVFPNAPLFTSVHDRRESTAAFRRHELHTSFLQGVAPRQQTLQFFAPLLPLAFRSFDLREYDVVLTSSSGFAHHVRTPPGAIHICYCYTPPRFLWSAEEYFRAHPRLARAASGPLALLRRADVAASRGVDSYVAISRHIAQRIRMVYGREAHVVYPPVAVSRYAPAGERSGRFLVVSRLMSYKRIDLAIEAANRFRLPLDVIGKGPEGTRLARMAGPTVRMLGWQPDEVVRHAIATCQAVVVPGSEDFGLTLVEAQASGRPPVAFSSGGALEIVGDGQTGFLFGEQTAEGVGMAMQRAAARELPVGPLIASAARFDVPVFKERLCSVIELERERRARVARGGG